VSQLAYDLSFKSFIANAYHKELETLVYFNSCQTRVWDGIVEAIERFGTPEIEVHAERLRVVLRKLPEAQCLFVVEADSGRPLGLAVYVRPDREHLTVLHVSIAAEFASGGLRCQEQLLLKLLRELRRCGRRVKGIEHLDLYYQAERQRLRKGNPRINAHS
jgi:hypothetical protein